MSDRVKSIHKINKRLDFSNEQSHKEYSSKDISSKVLSGTSSQPRQNLVVKKLTKKRLIATDKDCVKELTERTLALLEEKERMRMKLRRRVKKEKLYKQKINKMMFFFFTL